LARKQVSGRWPGEFSSQVSRSAHTRLLRPNPFQQGNAIDTEADQLATTAENLESQ
jgi:hypothetical protein